MVTLFVSHAELICTVCILVIQVLDWYNPYMDFMGHAAFLLDALCVSALWIGISQIFGRISVRYGALTGKPGRQRGPETGRRYNGGGQH